MKTIICFLSVQIMMTNSYIDTNALLSLQDLMFNTSKYSTANDILDGVNKLFRDNFLFPEDLNDDLVDPEYFEELKVISGRDDVTLRIGCSLRDIMCLIRDNNEREHEFKATYRAKKRIKVSMSPVPYDPYEDEMYQSVSHMINACKEYVNNLNDYLRELEEIDTKFTIVEPQNPTFKDDYRKIRLESKLWLHVEVTKTGVPTNIHPIGHIEDYEEWMQKKIATWDYDRDIASNVIDFFEHIHSKKQCGSCEGLYNCPNIVIKLADNSSYQEVEHPVDDEITCGICLSTELADTKAVARPICLNVKCGAFYHTSCLYIWLVTCAGGREPPLGVAIGQCPSCFQEISCPNE